MTETPPKREATPAQQANLEKAREARKANLAARAAGGTPPKTAAKRSHHKKKNPGATRAPGRERAPARPASPVLTRAQKDKVTGGMSFALLASDAALATFVPDQWTKEDRLTQDESGMLVTAVYTELETYRPLWLQALARFTTVTGAHAYLGAVVAAIAAPRLARRGLINEQLAAQLALAPYFLSIAAEQLAAESGGDAVHVATEPAPSGSGPEWDGQEHANGVATGNPAPVQGHSPL